MIAANRRKKTVTGGIDQTIDFRETTGEIRVRHLTDPHLRRIAQQGTNDSAG